MIVKYMRMRKICLFNRFRVISRVNRLTPTKKTDRRMTIFYQNRACETHKKMIFQRFSPILFYFSDFIVKIVLFFGVSLRVKSGSNWGQTGVKIMRGRVKGQALYIFIYIKGRIDPYRGLDLYISPRGEKQKQKNNKKIKSSN